MADIVKTSSVCFTKEMLAQLEWLKIYYGENTSRVISRALDVLYRDQIKN
jgi:hypothetical protein